MLLYKHHPREKKQFQNTGAGSKPWLSHSSVSAWALNGEGETLADGATRMEWQDWDGQGASAPIRHTAYTSISGPKFQGSHYLSSGLKYLQFRVTLNTQPKSALGSRAVGKYFNT
jgi:hypothetical protein